jgi:UDP-glucose 4-epimerase
MILVTGGGGFLGLNLAADLASRGVPTVVTTRDPTDPRLTAIDGPVTAEVVDLTNTYAVNSLFARYDFDTVVHLATSHMYAATRASNHASYAMLQNCLEAATWRRVSRFVLASSIAVYRGLDHPGSDGALTEDATFSPDTTVRDGGALSFVPHFEVTQKRVSECLALDYGVPFSSWDQAPPLGRDADGQLDVVVVRFPAQFGPRYVSMYNPLACAVHAAAGRGAPSRPLRMHSDLIYVTDSVSALRAVLDAKTLPHRIYNASGNIRASAPRALAALAALVPAARELVELDQAAPPGGDVHLDISRIRADLGWEPAFDLDGALADYVDWLATHEF